MVPFSFGCGSAVFAAIATLAPSRAARNAIASPMPRLPPDTNIVLPFRDVMEASSSFYKSLLLSHRFRAAGPRIGRTEQSIWSHRDRIGRRQAERLDHRVTPRFQARDDAGHRAEERQGGAGDGFAGWQPHHLG